MMPNGIPPKLLLEKLLHADSQNQVIEILKKAGYWDKSIVWRFYGDRESNYNTAGNQQSRSDAALVEKLVNSIDARLINECLSAGIDPESEDAPQSIREAVATFFDHGANSSTAGLIREWTQTKRARTAKGITIAATGSKPPGNPCFTIADIGEGQSPDKFPETFLSLDRDNKVKIPFVQGKFNMGGSGALEYCGENNLQLILSKRNPKLSKESKNARSAEWGFTVVRRENPIGGRKSSVYTYLAPVESTANPRNGQVLSFRADSFPIFPEGQKPYSREAEWGTLIKLYEYSTVGFSGTNVILKDGLLRQLDLLLSDLALPIRVYECREYSGHSGSFETNLNGISVRLNDDKAENLETEPFSLQLEVRIEKISGTVFVFKKGKDRNYKSNEGVIFSVNGQWHGGLTKAFFGRKKVDMDYLRNSILVVLDCSSVTPRSREQLFMTSRDRLRQGELLSDIEKELEEFLRNHSELKKIREKRRREEARALIEEDKPLGEVLQNLIQGSPTLAKLFLSGGRLSNPFNLEGVGDEDEPFEGRKFPTFFKLRELDYGETLVRTANKNKRPRITFETDAENMYFNERRVQPGEFSMTVLKNGLETELTHSINLFNGIATLNLRFPQEITEGDILEISSLVTDETRAEPFVNNIQITVVSPSKRRTRNGAGRKDPPSEDKGKDREAPSRLAMPNIIRVAKSSANNLVAWDEMDPPFDETSALRVKRAGAEEIEGVENQVESYDFYVNVDNLYLNTELKSSKEDPELVRTKFIYVLVLIGLAYLNHVRATDESSNEVNPQDVVEEFSSAVSPVVLPIVNEIGKLQTEMFSKEE